MKKTITSLLIAAGFCLSITLNSYAQIGQRLDVSQQFRLGDRLIRVAETDQLSDTVSVWGDVNSPGRYLIPIETTLPQLISYAFGPNTIVNGQTQLDWSQMRIEIHISEFNPETGKKTFTSFEYHPDEQLPEGIRTFDLKNNQVIALQVKRRPSFVDYVRVIAPVISALATSIIIIDRLSQ